MVEALADELVHVVDQAAANLRSLADAAASAKPKPEVWSIKEIVGHLIDSAVNNHHRFVRAQQADALTWPGYEQVAWVRVQHHQSRPWRELIDLWVLYNHHLAHTIRRIPDTALNVPCRIGTNDPVPLSFLLEDYLAHMRHHLTKIEQRRAARELPADRLPPTHARPDRRGPA